VTAASRQLVSQHSSWSVNIIDLSSRVALAARDLLFRCQATRRVLPALKRFSPPSRNRALR
jgi:hypothetical protein